MSSFREGRSLNGVSGAEIKLSISHQKQSRMSIVVRHFRQITKNRSIQDFSANTVRLPDDSPPCFSITSFIFTVYVISVYVKFAFTLFFKSKFPFSEYHYVQSYVNHIYEINKLTINDKRSLKQFKIQ